MHRGYRKRLLRFGVSNFKSLRERQEISLIATTLKDDEGGLIDTADRETKALPSAVLYGANASGKSNFISALQYMCNTIMFSHHTPSHINRMQRFPFALSKATLSEKTCFDIDYIVNNQRYHFGFEADNDGFASEWLYTFPNNRKVKLYERSGPQEIVFGRALKGRNRVIADLMRPDSLFMSAAVQNNHHQIIEAASFFVNISIINSITVGDADILYNFAKKDIDQRTINFLQKLETGIVGFERVEKIFESDEIKMRSAIFDFIKEHLFEGDANKTSADIEKESQIRLRHQGQDGGTVLFEPKQESAGTRRLLVMMAAIFSAIDDGYLVVIDELDASLHTQACEAIVTLFSNRSFNSKGAQLLTTTHDTNLMCSPALRRDQIWFAEKDRNGATNIFPLSDIQTRGSDNIEKGYLQGRFGAIPFAGSVASLFGNDSDGSKN